MVEQIHKQILFICEDPKCKHKQYANKYKKNDLGNYCEVLGMGCEKCHWNAKPFNALRMPN